MGGNANEKLRSITIHSTRPSPTKVPDSYSARKNVLEDVIAAHSCGGRVMVFTQTKSEADELSTSSPYAAENTRVLHGDITQRQREITLKQFRYVRPSFLPPSLPPSLSSFSLRV